MRVFLAAAYVFLGAMLLGEALLRRRDTKRDEPAHGGYFAGVVRAITNPSLIANWTLAITGLTATGALPRGAGAAAAFAIGVGAGVIARLVRCTRSCRSSRAR